MARGTVWFTGLSGAGKSTVAAALKAMLDEAAISSYQLDGDDLREGLNADLTFSEKDRRENIRRVGEVAILFSKISHLCLVTVISPFASGRDAVRARHEQCGIPFVEVHVATPLSVCEQRDPKGLYKRARTGEVAKFTGISSPYEIPFRPDIAVQTAGSTPMESAAEVFSLLETRGLLAQS